MKAKVKILSVLALMASATSQALDNPATFNFDGILVNDTTGTPMTGPVALKLQIYDPSGVCLLFEETHATVNLETDGSFTVKVGGGARASAGVDGGLNWKTVFSNKAQLRTTSSTNCSPGYTPATLDSRSLRVTVNGSTVLTPDFSLAGVPFATVADSIQGYYPSDFVSTAGGSSVNGFVKIDGGNALRLGDGGAYHVGLKAPASLGVSTIWSLPATDGTTGQVLKTDGSGNLGWVSAGGGGLPVSGGTMTGSLNLGGNTLVASGDITMSPTASLNLGNFTSSEQATLSGGLSVGDKGTMWFNSTTNTLNYWDGTAVQSLGGAGAPVTSVAGRTGAVSLTTADISGLGTAATKSFGVAAGNLVELNGSGLVPTAVLDPSVLLNGGNSLATAMNLGTNDSNTLNFKTNNTTQMSVTPAGTVGIGINTPAAKLQVNGVTASQPVAIFKSTDGSSAYSALQVRDNTDTVVAAIKLTAPTAAVDLTPKSYVDAAVSSGGATYVAKVGDTMTGSLALPNNGLTVGTTQLVVASGNVGIGTASPGATLDVVGQIKLSGGAPGVGKVLTSDAAGLATWQAPVAAAATSTYTTLGTSANGTATGHTAVGSQAGSNHTGINSTFIGYHAGDTGGTGTNNTVIGASALTGVAVNGSNNTVVGASAILTAAINHAVAIGNGAQVSGSGGVAIGSGASAPTSTVVIGSNNGGTFQEGLRIDPAGYVGIGTTTPTAKLDLNGDFKLGATGTPLMAIEHYSNITVSGCGGSYAAVGVSCTATIGGAGINTGQPNTVLCSPYGGGLTNGVFSCFVSASNQVTINVYFFSGASNSVPGGWNFTVIKP